MAGAKGLIQAKIIVIVCIILVVAGALFRAGRTRGIGRNLRVRIAAGNDGDGHGSEASPNGKQTRQRKRETRLVIVHLDSRSAISA